MQANGDLSSEITERETYEVIINIMKRVYSGTEEFFDTGEISRKDVSTTWAPGFRYVVQVGFRF
jgi:hypothetical protein